MIKDLKYSGITTAPSDYESPDGALTESLNLISEDQHLTPIFQPKLKVQLQAGQNILYIHKTFDFKYPHYIGINSENDVFWMQEEDGYKNHFIKGLPKGKIYQITSIGNTLLVLTEKGMLYFLWKNSSYIFLGDSIPECPISFGLKGESKLYSKSNGGKFNISFDAVSENDLKKELSDENKRKISDQVLPKVNKFIAEIGTNNGKFLSPFFVRYAYRLYDGSLSHHSAPILMIPSTRENPFVIWYGTPQKGSYSSAEVDLFANACSLDYQAFPEPTLENLKVWGDIVKSVDIFVSAPLYIYDQSGMCQSLRGSKAFDGFFIGKYIGGDTDTVRPIAAEFKKYYQRWDNGNLFDLAYEGYRHQTPMGLPVFSDENINGKIRDCYSFYLLKSIPVEDLKTVRTDIKVDSDFLGSLLSRELMTDDYQTHDTIIPSYSYTYNSRLNLANVKRRLFKGFNTVSMFPYVNGHVLNVTGTPYDLTNTTKVPITVKVQEEGRDIYMKNTCATELTDDIGFFMYYPDNSAKVMTFEVVSKQFEGNVTTRRHKVNLEPHVGLNGSFFFSGFLMPPTTQDTSHAESENRTIALPNKIYTSEINNPFFFPVTGINTVGTGTILGISSATKALSQGQFGQFPLYAFTNEGVWALEVSPTGTYSAKQPVTRDVCINSGSITQLDNAVLFATARGIMVISGSQTVCITDYIDSPAPFNALSLPGMAELHTAAGHGADTCLPTVPFLTFLEGCSMIYDYVHQHIVVFNKAYTYAYVYSLKSKEWGMMYSTFSIGINAYPDALAMTTDNKLVSFSDTDEGISTGLFLTRPIKLETPDVLKTIDTCIQRGMLKRGDVQTVLWGSRDLYNWQLIGSSVDNYLRGIRGTPYKYFRIAGITKFKPDMSLFGVTLQFTPKFTNTPR